MDLVCHGYFDCVLGNLLFGLLFGGWIFCLLVGYLVHGVLTWNPTFKNYSKSKRILITTAIVLGLAFVVVSVFYLIYGKGSNSTSLGF